MDHSVAFFIQFCLTVWQFRFILVTLFVLILLGGVIFAKVEKMSLETGIYFALQTAITLGFGDITAKTRLGRVISLAIGFLA